jgi:hypothetical protein
LKWVKQKKEVLHTKYNFSKKHKTYGRLFAQNPSLSNLPREVRNSIANETYYDVDIKNCHPQILYQYCKKQDIPCESLTTFVENRDAIITSLCERNFGMDKDIAKNTLLSVINGGGAVDFQEDKFVSKFTEEMKNIRDAVCRHRRGHVTKEYGPPHLDTEHLDDPAKCASWHSAWRLFDRPADTWSNCPSTSSAEAAAY